MGNAWVENRKMNLSISRSNPCEQTNCTFRQKTAIKTVYTQPAAGYPAFAVHIEIFQQKTVASAVNKDFYW